MRRVVALLVVTACGAPRGPAPAPAVAIAPDAAMRDASPRASSPGAAADAPPAGATPAKTPALGATPADVRWLKGSTHVHAKPSGDSAAPIPDVIRWYEARGYDFIALTDHNKISEVGETPTAGQVAVRAPAAGLIVLAGVELTHNPVGCQPPGDASGRCRIHVNLIGTTARPAGKIEWAARGTDDRVAKYQAALDQQPRLGGVAQLNHPQYYFGMTPEVLTAVARRGMRLYEVANVQFARWNAGAGEHLSTEALWDAALAQGVTLWGVASDDAHDYDNGTGPYPPGGGWVMVRARREPQAIVDALAAGAFYASTGVTLARAETVGGELVVEVEASEPGSHTITFVENGQTVASVRAKSARRAVPERGYVRAVVTRDDGKRAWVQPARRP